MKKSFQLIKKYPIRFIIVITMCIILLCYNIGNNYNGVAWWFIQASLIDIPVVLTIFELLKGSGKSLVRGNGGEINLVFSMHYLVFLDKMLCWW